MVCIVNGGDRVVEWAWNGWRRDYVRRDIVLQKRELSCISTRVFPWFLALRLLRLKRGRLGEEDADLLRDIADTL